MAEYHVIADDNRCFRLSEGPRAVGELTYPNWFSFEATLALAADPTPFAVNPRGLWGTTVELQQHGRTLLRFEMGWNGTIILHAAFEGQEPQDFLFKLQGLFNIQYVLTDAQHQELLIVQLDFKWKKFKYEYSLFTTEVFEALAGKDVLLLLAVHCTNYFINTMSA